jgi:hypothetical protein
MNFKIKYRVFLFCYSSLNFVSIIKSIRIILEEQTTCIREKRIEYRALVGKPEGKRTLERPRHAWVKHIKMGVKEIGWEGVDCIHVAQDSDQ